MFCCVNNEMYFSIRMLHFVKIGTQKNDTLSYEVYNVTNIIMVLQTRSALPELQFFSFITLALLSVIV